MKKLLCLVMFCLTFGLVLYNANLVYAEKELLKSNYKPFFLNDEDQQIYYEKWNNKLTVEQYEKFKKEHADFIKQTKDKSSRVFEEYIAEIDRLRKESETNAELKKAFDIYDRIQDKFFGPNRGSYDSMLELVNECVAIKSIGDTHLKKTAYYLKNKDFKGLLEWLNKFDDKEQRIVPGFYFYKAVAYYNLGIYNKALEYCNKGIKETEPKFAGLYICRAFVNKRLNNEKGYKNDIKLGIILAAINEEEFRKEREGK